MEFIITNQNFEKIYVLELFESILWVDKFNEPGTFEINAPVTTNNLLYLKPNNCIFSDISEHIMIIEDVSFESNAESGNKIKVVGRSLESILDRRIVWKQTNFHNATLNDTIATLLNDAIVNPSIVDRKIDNFASYTASEDSYITGLKVNHQYTGDNLLDVIQSLCEEFSIGFKITLNDSNQFVFSLYTGTNRSYNQSNNSYVIFSPEYENLISSNYTDKMSVMKNIALVGGEGTGTSRKFKTVGAKKGIDRRETFVNASDIQKESLSNAKYNALLEKRGLSTLDAINRRVTFDCECDTSRSFVYGRDFFMGDIVQVANEYGIEAPLRVTEFTWSCTTNGIETYPTFLAMENDVVTGKNLLATTLENLQALNTSGEWSGNVWCNSNMIVTVNTDAHDRVVGITVDGKNATSNSINFILGEVQSDTADGLILSGCTGGASGTYFIVLYDKTASSTRVTNYSGDTAITGMVLTNTNQVRFTLKNGKTVDNITLYPMVRKSSESSTFEPYNPNLA